MPATLAKAALGTKLKFGAVYIEELNTITGPAQKVATLDVTNMDSPSSYAEHIASIIDGGTVTVSGNWIGSTNQKNLLAELGKVAASYKVELPGTQPGAGHWDFSAVLADFAFDAKHSAQLVFSATLKITGAVTFAIV